MTGDNHDVERRQRGQNGLSPTSALEQLPARVILERIPLPVLAIVRDGSIVFANPAFAEMIGRAPSALVSLHFAEVFLSVSVDHPPVSALRAYANQVVELAHSDGSVVRARMSKSALLRDDDPLALATFEDVTEQLWALGR